MERMGIKQRPSLPVTAAGRRRRFDDRDLGYLFVLPAVAVLCFVLIFPLLYATYLSFNQIGANFEGQFVGLQNYADILGDAAFWKALRNTVVFTAASVTLHFVLGLAVALLLNQQIKARTFFRMLMLVPWLVPAVVTAMTWKWMLNSQYGILNDLLMRLHLITAAVPWIASVEWAMPSVVLAATWQGFPFAMVMLLAGLQTVPREQLEAAAVDGASIWQRFRYVTIPNLQFVILVVTILDTIWTFKSFDLIQVLTAGGPVGSTEVLATLVYRLSFKFFRFGFAAAIAVLMLLVLFAFSLIYLRVLERQEQR